MQASAFSRGKEAPVGAMNRRITIQQATVTQDAVGGEVTAWADFVTVWAYVNPLSGHELVNAQSVYAEVSHLMVVRWQAVLSDPQAVARMRIVYAGRHFNIGSADDIDMEHRFLALFVQEGLVDG